VQSLHIRLLRVDPFQGRNIPVPKIEALHGRHENEIGNFLENRWNNSD
jgi:hypothetical protein